MHSRRLTPSMSLLLAFDAAGRHGSFTRAGQELSLTQSAVSRQVQALESQLEVALFTRQGRTIALTEVGRLYLREVGQALDQLRGATLQVLAQQGGGGTLRLALLPTFGSKWLLPRLHAFYAAHPGVQVHIHSHTGAVDFDQAQVDAAIGVAVAPGGGVVRHPLLEEAMVVVLSPSVVAAGQQADPALVARQPLLRVGSHPPLWPDWFARHGLPGQAVRAGPSFELTSHLLLAVRAGIGAGLVPTLLAEDELRAGTLVQVGQPLRSRRTYQLAYPARHAGLPALQAFRDWLLGDLPGPA